MFTFEVLKISIAMITFVNHPVETTSHKETIECTECNHVQEATVEHTFPFYSYVHHCTNCQYIIMESEWEKVETTNFKNQ